MQYRLVTTTFSTTVTDWQDVYSRSNTNINYKFETNTFFTLRLEVEGIKRFIISLSNYKTYDNRTQDDFRIYSYDENNQYTLLIRSPLYLLTEIDTLSDTKYIQIFIRGEVGHYFTIDIKESALTDKILNSDVLSLILKDIRFSSAYDLSKITDFNVCCAHEVYSSTNKYYNGIFMLYDNSWVFATNVYGSKDEALSAAVNGFYSINGLHFYIDYSLFKTYDITRFGTPNCNHFVFSDNLKLRNIGGKLDSVTSLFNNYSIGKQFEYDIIGTSSLNCYIQWKKLNHDVLLTKVLFSETAAEESVTFKVGVYDDVNMCFYSCVQARVEQGNNFAILDEPLLVPKQCLVFIDGAEYLYGYTSGTLDGYVHKYRRHFNDPSSIIINSSIFSDLLFTLGVGFEYKESFEYDEQKIDNKIKSAIEITLPTIYLPGVNSNEFIYVSNYIWYQWIPQNKVCHIETLYNINPDELYDRPILIGILNNELKVVSIKRYVVPANATSIAIDIDLQPNYFIGVSDDVQHLFKFNRQSLVCQTYVSRKNIGDIAVTS